jgi:hypothetical protein
VVLPNPIYDDPIKPLAILPEPSLEFRLEAVFWPGWAKSMDLAAGDLSEVSRRIVERGYFNFVAIPLMRGNKHSHRS